MTPKRVVIVYKEKIGESMKYLAVDSSTKALSVALIEDTAVVAENTLLPQQQHGVLLVPAVAQLLEQMNWKTSDLEGLLVGVGPGSYTGLRMGVTFAKTWANSKKLPIASVSSLALIAAASLPLGENVSVLPVMDARRLSAYTAIYKWDTEEKLVSVVADSHVDWREWLPTVSEHLGEQVVLVGTGIEEFVEAFQEIYPDKTVEVITDWAAWPHAGRAVFCPRELVAEPTLLAPNYAHATLAEREWAEKNNTTIASEKDNEAFIEHFT